MDDGATPEDHGLDVAIVHASDVARAHLAQVVRGLGHRVTIGTATGREIAARRVQVAVFDGRAPHALDEIAALRELDADVKILVLASLDEIALVRSCIDAGANGAIRRPPLRSRVVEALAAAGLK